MHWLQGGICMALVIDQFKVVGLRLTQITVPTYELYGGSAILECHYELNKFNQQQKQRPPTLPMPMPTADGDYSADSGDQSTDGHRLDAERERLYSVKWYKDNEEFYRFVPGANPPQQAYRIDGVRVDLEASNTVRVKLKRLTLKASGVYRCEVSAEAPNFSSDQGEGRMEVIYLARDGPYITGEEHQFSVGDTLQLNCTSGKSHPAPHVKWLINDEPVSTKSLIHYENARFTHGLLTTVLGLRLFLQPEHFPAAEMRVKCVASVSPVAWKSGEAGMLMRRPQQQYREAILLVRSGSWRLKMGAGDVLIWTLLGLSIGYL